jgi:hypothetical protein
VNDLEFVLRAVDLLASRGVKTWVSGTWAEELHGLIPPQPHASLELLYPARDWQRVDELPLDWLTAERHRWKRGFSLEGTSVELCLVERGERGWYTRRGRRLHEWPDDVFAGNGRLPLASPAAFAGDQRPQRRAA